LAFAPDAIQCGIDVYGQANSASFIGNGSADGLTNPPGRMSRETMSTPPVIALHGPNKADVTLLDQVEQRQATADIAFGNADDQAQIRQDELLHSIAVTHLDALGQFYFAL